MKNEPGNGITKMKQAREAHNLTQAGISYLSNVPAPYISMMESGRLKPTSDQAERLAKVLGLAPEELLAKVPD